jgi:hypothetical protein
MITGDLTFEDETMVHARETKPTICIDIEYNEIHAWTYINKEQAKEIIKHLENVFDISTIEEGHGL